MPKKACNFELVFLPYRIVLTRMCFGEPQPDCGKFHNHCVLCPGFGMCIDDYRYAHCNSCGDHFRAGLSGLQYTPNGWRQVGSQCDECCDDEGSEDESSDEWEDYEDESRSGLCLNFFLFTFC